MKSVVCGAALAALSSSHVTAKAPAQDTITRGTNEIKWSLQSCKNGLDKFDFNQFDFAREACELAERVELSWKPNIQPNCLPKMFAPPSGTQVKGAVLLWHGFTACPDQYVELADKLANEGMYVFIPLVTGHGREYMEGCQNRNAEDDENAALTCNGDDISELPDSPDEYVNLVKNTVEAFKNDIEKLGLEKGKHKFGTYGLSNGAALAARTLIDDTEDLFTNGVIGSAFLGMSIDDRQGTSKDRIKLVTHRFSPLTLLPPVREMTHSYNGWGEGCEKQRRIGRGGICSFLQINIMAASTFAETVVEEANEISTKHFDAILVDDDGGWSNAVAVKLMQNTQKESTRSSWFGLVEHTKAAKPDTGMCLYPYNIPEGKDRAWCGGKVACGVPHSNVNRLEASVKYLGENPEFYWWDSISNQIVNSLTKDKHVGDAEPLWSVVADPNRGPLKEKCYIVDSDKWLPEAYFWNTVVTGEFDM